MNCRANTPSFFFYFPYKLISVCRSTSLDIQVGSYVAVRLISEMRKASLAVYIAQVFIQLCDAISTPSKTLAIWLGVKHMYPEILKLS